MNESSSWKKEMKFLQVGKKLKLVESLSLGVLCVTLCCMLGVFLTFVTICIGIWEAYILGTENVKNKKSSNKNIYKTKTIL